MMNYDTEEEMEMVISTLRDLKRAQKTQGRMLQFHQNQIEIAQKSSTACQCRITGFWNDWPSQNSRCEIMASVLHELGMEPRDLLDIQERGWNGQMPAAPLLTFRTESRKSYFLGKMFGRFSAGFELEGNNKEYEITLFAQSLDPPISRKTRDAKKALCHCIHQQTGQHRDVKAYCNTGTGPFKISFQNEVVLMMEENECVLTVTVQEAWFDEVKKIFPGTLLGKTAPKHIKDAYMAVDSDASAAAPEQEFFDNSPFEFKFRSTPNFAGSPLESMKKREEQFAMRSKGKGEDSGKDKGKGKGKKKGKGGGAQGAGGGTQDGDAKGGTAK